MKPIIYLFTFVIALLLFACSDDTNPAAESFDYRQYFPLDSGNLWTYEYYALDSNGSNYKSPYGRETVIATDSTYHIDRNATIMNIEYVNNGNTSIHDLLYSKDTNQIAISGLEIKIHDSLSYVEDRWVILFDIDQYTGPWVNRSIVYNDTVIGDSKYYGTVDIEGERAGKTKIEYEGKSFDAVISKLYIYYNIERKRALDTMYITKREEIEFRFAKSVGMVYSSFKQFQDTNFISGNKKILINREF